ncbi:MAG: hypothetical protein JNK24_08380 [Alphaproteobacteria bacterium]|nr:hypothetical protein [Alphaproteobacteria bacterium]
MPSVSATFRFLSLLFSLPFTACLLMFTMALVMSAHTAHARDKSRDITDGKSSETAVAKLICERRYMTAASPDAANYHGGSDVYGNAVAPADLAPPPAIMGDATGDTTYIEAPLTVDLAARMDIPLAGRPEMKSAIGNLKLFRDGHIEYNGQDMTDRVAAYCGFAAPKSPMPQPAPMMLPEPSLGAKDPLAGSVAPSQTIEDPALKLKYEMPKGTANISR